MTISQFFGVWSFDAFIAANLLAAAIAYLFGVRRLHQTEPGARWPALRSASFLAGILLLALMYLGPLPAWSHTFFWAHMTQHLVVMMLAAPLIVLGAPITLIYRASSKQTRVLRLDPLFASRAVRLLSDPILTWILFAGVLLGTHFTPFYNWALVNHDLDIFVEQPLYLIAALLFYLPLIGSNSPWPSPAPALRLLSMALMMLPEAAIGAVIYFAPVVMYPAYESVVRPFGPAPLADQQLSGALMWALVMVVDSFWMMICAAEWFASEERRSHEVDAQIAAELAGQRG